MAKITRAFAPVTVVLDTYVDFNLFRAALNYARQEENVDLELCEWAEDMLKELNELPKGG